MPLVYKIGLKLIIVCKIILENNLARTVYEYLTVYEYPNFILCLKVWNGVMNCILKLQAETDILIICWLTEIFDKQMLWKYFQDHCYGILHT